jgi:hypothetical protein
MDFLGQVEAQSQFFGFYCAANAQFFEKVASPKAI